MDKKRMTAGSVEELLEIVRAVQNGEDPDIDKIREEQRKKREEEILERRRKRSSQGSADSAEPSGMSEKRKKTEKKQEDTREPEEGRDETDKPEGKKPDEGDIPAEEPEAEEPERVADDFSWPQFDPRKMLAERNARAGEDGEAAENDGTEENGEETGGPEDTGDGEEEDTEEEGRLGIFDRLWGRRDMDPEDEEEEPEDGELLEPSDQEKDGADGGSPEEEDDFDDDEFERLLNEDNTEEEFIKSRETMTAFTAKVVGLFGSLQKKAGEAAAANREKARRREKEPDRFPDDSPAAVSEEKAETKSTKERSTRGKSGNGELEADRNHIRSLERSLSRVYREDEDFEDDFTDREERSGLTDREKEREQPGLSDREEEREWSGLPDREKEEERPGLSNREEEREQPGLSDREEEREQTGLSDREEEKEWPGLSNRKEEREQPGLSDREEKGEQTEPENEGSGRNLKRRPRRREPEKEAGGEENRREPSEKRQGKGSSERRKKPAVKRKRPGDGIRLPGGIPDLLHAAREHVSGVLADLEQRGIHKKELAMLAMVLLFVLLILFFLVNAVQNFFGQRQKSRNVTADKGLTVTVEDEPQDWASSYPVKLKLSCRTGSISSVEINGVPCTPDENGMVTVETGDWRLQMQVKTDDGTKTAKIEIPMLDDEAPDLDVKREEDTIVLSAADTRSQVEGIYYAVENPDGGYERLPEYRKYEEPLKYEEGMIYRFYAKDKAGNITIPTATTLEDAESFALAKTHMSLFPGETCDLGVEAEPAGALLRNLKFESLDPSVVTVEENGKVTAVGEGTAEVRVSADQMESQSCTFEVSEERTVLVSAVGDCTLGTDESFDTTTSFNAFDAVNGHDYFFRNVKDILGADDVTFANFEGTLTDSTAREAKQFAFKGDPSYTEILKDGSVEVVTLANNHSRDYGEQSLEDTKEALKEADIDYCIGDEIVIREVSGVQTAFIGIYVLDSGLEVQSQVVQTILQARQLGAKIVIVAFHWGSEKATVPDETQRSLAHTAIDRGADLVVGHHPHVLQGIEQYNGKYIVYSLANFCFGGNSSPSDMDTMIFQQSFTVKQDGTVENGEISVIPCSISSESGYNNYQPTPASGEEAQRIIGRLNEYSEEFGQTYTAAER